MINQYVAAGYALIWFSLLAYAWRTWRRLSAAERAVAALEADKALSTVDT